MANADCEHVLITLLLEYTGLGSLFMGFIIWLSKNPLQNYPVERSISASRFERTI
jgi:hypothetical protein